MTVAIYAGSFDPITNGHIDIVTRAAKLFDRVIMAVYKTPDKQLFFTTEERVEMAEQAVSHLPNVRVECFSGLVVDLAARVKAQTMIRGLRMSADFDREFEMAMMNKKLSPDLELVCFMASQEYQFLSSSLLKEVASLGGCIDNLVPSRVAEALSEKVHNQTS